MQETYYIVEDYDSKWSEHEDRMEAVSSAWRRYRDLMNTELEQWTYVYEVSKVDGVVVSKTKIDWEKDLKELFFG